MCSRNNFKLCLNLDPELRRISERLLCRCAKRGNRDQVQALLTVCKVNVNCLDRQGVSPLQHAAFNGNYLVCKLLLDNGADVDAPSHPGRYSALTFAAVAGALDVISLLIEHGANINHLNSISRTPSQMSQFVKNLEVPKFISYFVTLEEIMQVAESVPSLRSICPIVQKIANMTNVHLVQLALFMRDNFQIIEKIYDLSELFRLLSLKKMEEHEELSSFKYHLFSHGFFVIHDFITCANKHKYFTPATYFDTLQKCVVDLIQHLIKGEKSDGFPMCLEYMLRLAMKTYPYLEWEAFANVRHILQNVQQGDEPSAISFIRKMINTLRCQDNKLFCYTCSEPLISKSFECCFALYCSIDCQHLHWSTHQTVCQKLSSISHVEEERETSTSCFQDQVLFCSVCNSLIT